MMREVVEGQHARHLSRWRNMLGLRPIAEDATGHAHHAWIVRGEGHVFGTKLDALARDVDARVPPLAPWVPTA